MDREQDRYVRLRKCLIDADTASAVACVRAADSPGLQRGHSPRHLSRGGLVATKLLIDLDRR